MSEYDSLIEGYPGLDDPANDPGPLSQAEMEALVKVAPVIAPALADFVDPPDSGDEPPFDPSDWPEEGPITDETVEAIAEVEAVTELRALKPDVRPQVGKHYVIYGGKPMPVVRDSLTATEDEFVRDNLFVPTDLKDHDGQRQARADRTLRLRFRGYICGEMSSL